MVRREYLCILVALFGAINASEVLDLTIAPGSSGSAPVNTQIFNEVVFAGVADGKVFWAVTETDSMNWTTAGDSCTRRNMKLAEITSSAQAHAITSTYQESGNIMCCTYWTAARDAQVLRQFSWNSSNIDVSSSGVQLEYSVPLYGCLTFQVNTGVFRYIECGPTHSLAVLCEITLPSLEK